MIIIVGENEISSKLKEAAAASCVDCEIAASAAEVKDCDLVIVNAATEEERKAEVAAALEKTTGPVAARLRLEYACSYGKGLEAKNRIVGIRTMEADFIGKFIEITKTFDTDEETYAKAKGVLASFNERVAEVADVPGGIYYRILPLTINAGACLVSEGVTAEDVDKCCFYGANIKRPPLKTADELGVDYVYEVLSGIFEEIGRPAYRPSPLLKKMVNAGRTGKKAGRGFFEYN